MTDTLEPTVTAEDLHAQVTSDERFEAGDYTGLLERLDRTGDSKTMWDKNNTAEVAMAQAAFEAAQKAGLSIFRVEGKKGKTGERMTEFDPTAERMIAIPQLVGG